MTEGFEIASLTLQLLLGSLVTSFGRDLWEKRNHTTGQAGLSRSKLFKIGQCQTARMVECTPGNNAERSEEALLPRLNCLELSNSKKWLNVLQKRVCHYCLFSRRSSLRDPSRGEPDT